MTARFIGCAAVFGLAVCGSAVHASESSSPTPKKLATQTCATTVVSSGWPPTDGKYLVVFNATAVPPTPVLIRTYLDPRRSYWRYTSKFAIWLRDGGPTVQIAIPKRWQRVVAMDWGNSGNVSAIQFTSCPATTAGARAWTGGFNVSKRSVCVPVFFRVGSHTRRVLFAIGKHCPG